MNDLDRLHAEERRPGVAYGLWASLGLLGHPPTYLGRPYQLVMEPDSATPDSGTGQ